MLTVDILRQIDLLRQIHHCHILCAALDDQTIEWSYEGMTNHTYISQFIDWYSPHATPRLRHGMGRVYDVEPFNVLTYVLDIFAR